MGMSPRSSEAFQSSRDTGEGGAVGKGSWRPLSAFPGSGFFPGQHGCPWTQPVTALENLFLDRAKS